MKSLFRLCPLLLVWMASASVGSSRNLEEPVTVPFTLPTTAIAVKVDVAGRERTMVLSTSTLAGYLRSDERDLIRSAVTVGGRSLGEYAFVPAGEETVRVLGGDGALGMDTLRKTAVGIDVFGGQAALWPGGKLSPQVAVAWIAGGDEGRKIRRYPLQQMPDGTMALEAQVGGSTLPVQVKLGFNLSVFEPQAKVPNYPLGDTGYSLLSDLRIGGRAAGPILYHPAPEGMIDKKVGTSGLFILDALGSPRILVDFAAKAVYVQELGDDERLSLFLHRTLRVPLTVKGERIFLEPMPGYRESTPTTPYFGSRVLSIGKMPTEEWLADLRGREGSFAKSLANRIASTNAGYALQILQPDRTETWLNIHLSGVN